MSQSVNENEFFEAVIEGETDVVREYLEGVNSYLVHAVDSGGQTPLHLACLQNDFGMVALLVSKKADYNVKNDAGQSSFDIAREFDYLDIIKLFLIDNRKDVFPSDLAYALRMAVFISDYELLDIITSNYPDFCKETDENGDNILHFSVGKNIYEVTRRLTYIGVKVNCQNKNGQTPLHIAAKLNFSQIAHLLLLYSDRDTVNSQDSDGNTALHFAAQSNNCFLIRELLTEGATLDVANRQGMTPLQVSIVHNCFKATFELLKVGANVNVKDRNGDTPLHLSVLNDKLAKEILQKNAKNVNSLNIYDQTPVHIAIELNNYELAKFLIQNAPFCVFNAKDSIGNTLLHIATLKDNQELIGLLVSRGAMLNLTNADGQSPLHVAIQNDCHQAFDKLVYLGADVNLPDREGKLPLHLAVSKGVLSVVGRLVKSGAGLECKDCHGRTPIYYAAKCESLQVLKYLYFSGADTSNQSNKQTLIHVALEACPYLGTSDNECKNCCQVIDWLLYMGIDINAQDIKGNTALHIATRYGCISLVKHLYEQDLRNYDILLELQNEDGQTPLHIAALYNWHLFDLLLGQKADPDSKDNRGVTPFNILVERYKDLEDIIIHNSNTSLPMVHYILSLRLLNIADLLLDRQGSIEMKFRGDTPLLYTIDKGLKKETQYLIDKGANVNATNFYGYSALQMAISRCDMGKIYITMAHALILGGADVNYRSQDGTTALHIALEKERVYPFLLRILLDSGAVIDVVDCRMKTPLDYVSSENMQNPLVKTLLRHNLIMVKCVNMLSISVDFSYSGFEDFHQCCLKEIQQMKKERCGRNSLYDIFGEFKNPTYIFNQLLEAKVKSLAVNGNEMYPIYCSLLRQTYQRAKKRYTLIQKAQRFFFSLKNSALPSLPDEVQRMILYSLWENDLETLFNMSR